jgi:autotransporter-associated beta strand protein
MLVRILARRLQLLPALTLILAASQSPANIYQWAWVNSSDHSQGVLQSSTLCPSGSGVNAGPGADLDSLDLTQAYLLAANLTNTNLSGSTLTNANFTGGTLTNAVFSAATLTNANLTDTYVTGADFGSSNLTTSQLYTTASYVAQNLQGIGLKGNDLTGWNLAGQNLSHANLKNTNLTTASLFSAALNDVNLSGATVLGAIFGNTNITSSQLYGTASYQLHNLKDINLEGDNLTGWNFAGQYMKGAALYSATLAGANFTGANASNIDLFAATLNGANLTNANLQQADLSLASFGGANLTGADLRASEQYDGSGAIMTNTIGFDGTIQGLNLNAATPLLVVHNALLSIPIHVTGGMAVAGGGTLQVVFDGPTWASTISFAASTNVSLGGDLDLQVAPNIDLSTLLGHSFQVFNWSGVSPSGQFGEITSDLPTGYSWNTSALYTSGIINLTQVSIGPANGQWATNGGGSWSSTANWTGGNVPGQPQDTALFGTVLTAGTANVTLDMHASLASLAFSTTGGASYLITSTSGNSLTLSNTGGPATISDSGSNTITAPITLQSNLSVSASAGSVLTIAGAISESGSDFSLTYSGGGRLVLSGTNTYSGGTFVESGRVVVTNSAALLNGSSLTVGNSAAFAPVVPAVSSDAEQTLSPDLVPVPEPSTWMLIATAASCFLLLRSRLAKLRPIDRLVAEPHPPLKMCAVSQVVLGRCLGDRQRPGEPRARGQ